MKIIRSFLFDGFFYMTTASVCLLLWPLLFLPLHQRFIVTTIWSKAVSFGARYILGLKFVVEGRENLPDGPYLVACKHQSAWETVILNEIIPRSTFIMKIELTYIPFINFFFRRLCAISVRRGMGIKSIEDMLRQSKDRIQEGVSIIIFPEGERTRPGEKIPYKQGVSTLYKVLKVPVVPIALNSGLFWKRRALIKHPGTITVRILPPILPGMQRDDFFNRLHNAIETASDDLYHQAKNLKPQKEIDPC